MDRVVNEMLVKVCGIKTEEALVAADINGADLIGFIFVRDSHRYLEPHKAAHLALKLHRAKSVGVFVNEDIDEVNRIALMCNLSYVQLHGTEHADYARCICRPVIKAWRWGDNFSLTAAKKYPAIMHIIDSYRPGVLGGTGEVFRWHEAVEELATFQEPFLVAGGITEENALDAIETFRPTGIDISGGLEEGREKSVKKIISFLHKVNQWRGEHHA